MFFAIDLFMVGYAWNAKFGAILYNIGHSYVLPMVLIIFGLFFDRSVLFMVATIWMGHIGMDRMLGFGLKDTTAFKETHLQKV